ncbi:MAG TPA: FecR family protein [Burkholderiales bacterium]|nr:FecR family protein [Burkholderiales bacterium]
MIPRRLLIPLCATLALLAPPAGAEPVGRVLVAVGDVALVRAARIIPALNGTPVETGDQVRTGPASSAQIRFTDSAIVSVKPQTLFAVSEYAFSGQEDGSEKAVFELIRGGFRTVTGLIGHINKRSYQLRTPTATVGIRGTVWGAQQCEAGQCKQPDGSNAPAGTYGEVKSGAIAVSNDAGESDFGPNTAFYVADSKSAATRLLATPEFVLDRLDARSRNVGKNGGESGSVNLSAAGDGRVTPLPGTYAPLTFVSSDSRNADGSSAVINAITTTGFISVYTLSASSFDGIDSCTNPPCNATEPTTFQFNGNQLVSYGGSAAGTTALTQTGTVANLQTLLLSNGDSIIVAQLTGSYAGVSTAGTPFSGPGGFVYIATNSSLVTLNAGLPASGSFSFGSPGPFILVAADAAGNSTTAGSFSGSFNAATRAVSFSGSINFANIPTFGAASFSLGGSGTIPGGGDTLKNAPFSWTCTGAGCQSGAGSGNFDSAFIHSATNISAQVLDGGLLSATKNGATGNTVVFGAALKCASGAC